MDIHGRLISNQPLNDYTRQLVIKPPVQTQITFTAGQFMLIEVGPNLKRAYSIANPEYVTDRLEFVIDTRPGGPGSQFALTIEKGDEIYLSGPFGQLKVRDNNLPKVFIANGCGIPPLKSMIETLLWKGKKIPVRLLWGMRHLADLYFEKRFAGLHVKYPHFSFQYCLSQPEQEAQFCSVGHVNDALCLELEKEKEAEFYLCGKKEMVEEISNILKQKRITEDRIIAESY